MGPRQGMVRLTRTGVFALVCLALAAGAHALAGGGLPPLGVLLLGAVPVWLSGLALTTRRLRAGAIAASLGAAQAGLHVFFHLTAAPSAHGLVAVHSHAHGVPIAPPASAASAAAHTPGLLASVTPTMLLAHVAATVIAALALAYGEDLLWRVVCRLCRRPIQAATSPAAPLWQVHPTPARAWSRLFLVASPWRGPPVGQAS